MPRSAGIPGWLLAVLVAAFTVAAPPNSQSLAQSGENARAGSAPEIEQGRVTGLPIPRFVSLRADRVNMRTGPGLRYPIDWVYRRKDMPVRIVDEFEAWRRIRDWEGALGWVHSVMLQGKRTARLVGDEPALLRAQGTLHAQPVALVPHGAVGTLDSCEGNWCLLDFDGHSGWLRRDRLFGVDTRD